MAITSVWKNYKYRVGSGTTTTSDSFDSTGYTHILVGMRWQQDDTVGCTPSDNKGTTQWNLLEKLQVPTRLIWGQFAWAKIGSPGTGHIVTTTTDPDALETIILVWLINASSGGITVVDTLQGTGISSPGTASPGNLDNPEARSVISFFQINLWGSASWTPGTGWTEDSDDTERNAGFSRAAETTTAIAVSATSVGIAEWAINAVSFKDGTDRVIHTTTNRQLSR